MSDIAKGITDCLDTINKLRDENQELRAFEGSEALANGDFSVCIRGADRIEAQAARIAQLEATLRQFFDGEMDAIVKRILGAKVTGGKDE